MSRSSMRCLGISLAAFSQLRVGSADIPVHCLRNQVVGDWSFVLSPASEKRSACGHARPDVAEQQPSRQAVVDARGSTTQLSLKLQDPNIVVTANGTKGTWTMIYDEGFEVNLRETSLFAFSNFTFEGEKKHNVSHCGQTMVGWYRNADRSRFGCWYGSRVGLADGRTAPVTGVAASPVSTKKEVDPKNEVLDGVAQHKKVAGINKKLAMLQLGWRARVVPKWNGQTLRDVNAYAGLHRGGRSAKELRRGMLRQAETQQHSLRKNSFLQKVTDMPKDFDWSDVKGVDYLEPVMDQQDCGSCYAASSVRMLTARHKIKQNNTSLLPWSINFPLQCSEYNQGCKGGYGFLLARWSNDVGLLPATCMRYNTAGKCSLECDLDKLEGKRYRAGNHRYVGEYYGKANEALMMQELYAHGPMSVGVEPDEDFMFYSDGIYKSANPKNNRTENDWEQVDHGVLLVGWGEEDGQKYWRIQNSWGPDWGEDGFFRIVRGQDEAAIESMAEATDVVEDEQNGRRVAEFFQDLKARRVL